MEANKKRYHNEYVRTSYVEGNTVRKLNAVPDIDRRERVRQVPTPQRQVRRQPKALSGMNFASLVVLTIAIAATVSMCVNYIMLQTKVSQMEKSIVTLEKELTSLTKENNAKYEAINTAYDLDYVYQVAVGELGMVYPKDNKVITYEGGSAEYVRQYEDIPK